MIDQIKEKFINVFESELLLEIAKNGVLRNFEKGQVLIKKDQYLKSIPLVLSSKVKIVRENEEGGELLLYHIGKGDTCALSMSCCFKRKKSEIRAIVEEEGEVVLIPLEMMEIWMKFRSWREFIFESYNIRFEELLHALDTVAFMKLDERLMNYLLDAKGQTDGFSILKTHQEIANDMNTSRVVISRLLKKLEAEDKIELHRNKIDIL